LQPIIAMPTMGPGNPRVVRWLPDVCADAAVGVQMGVREARLRAEWAFLYPGLAPGEWIAASELVPLVLRHRLQDQRGWEFTRRILVDEHFEFRGGRPRDESWTGVLSRVEDA
jgi:hypothetical protein